MRVDTRHRAEGRHGGQQMLRDAQLDLADDDQLGLAHEVQRAADGALGGVLDGHHRVVGLAGFSSAEDFVDRRVGLGVDEIAEMPSDGGMAERTRRPQVGDAQPALEREARRHHLAENAGNRLVGQRAAVFQLQRAKHLRFALGAVCCPLAFERTDRLGMRRALVEQTQELAIERVDRVAAVLELLLLVGHRLEIRQSAYSSPASSVSTTRSSPASFSPSPRLIKVTPCVERPISRIEETSVRISTPPVEISITSSLDRTRAAATTWPLRSLCWMAIMPLVPRPWRVYSTIGVRLP